MLYIFSYPVCLFVGFFSFSFCYSSTVLTTGTVYSSIPLCSFTPCHMYIYIYTHTPFFCSGILPLLLFAHRILIYLLFASVSIGGLLTWISVSMASIVSIDSRCFLFILCRHIQSSLNCSLIVCLFIVQLRAEHRGFTLVSRR